jgi:hypothetical protein
MNVVHDKPISYYSFHHQCLCGLDKKNDKLKEKYS